MKTANEPTTATLPEVQPTALREHIVEIVSDSGEGAQTAGQMFGTISAKMGNGIWTVELIPAEIEPPARSIAGVSGNRIRLGSSPVTNAGDAADLVVAFNEQVLLGRVRSGDLKPGCTILLESMWRTASDPSIVEQYAKTHEKLVADGYRVIEVPMQQEMVRVAGNVQRGKNMFVVGMLCRIYSRDLEIAHHQISYAFRKKKEALEQNRKLFDAGYEWAGKNLPFRYQIPGAALREPHVVVNGNTAAALGVVASGMEICAMYPITPATSVSHYLSEIFSDAGGTVHQAEDEIAACGFAIGASYAGKVAVTVTSGPGLALKTELIGLAVMAEIPLVLLDVQRGGPATGLPTKVEQGDLLTVLFGQPGDAPKIVMAPATIEDCFYSMIAARQIAETFRTPVVVLSDANLATGQQAFLRPKFREEWVSPPIDLSPAPKVPPYDWDAKTGLSKRFIPGQPGGMFTLTGLAHTRTGEVAYDPGVNQEGCRHRSLKLAAFQKTLKAPEVFGDAAGGDLLLVGWGSTKGAIEEAVTRAREDGLKVSSLHLKFLQPMASGIKEILGRWKKVICVEINYSDSFEDELISEDNRRYSNLAWLLRARTLLDIDCWSNVHGQPLKPGSVERMIRDQIQKLKK